MAAYRCFIAIGDSNTFGWTVDDGANWPAQLEGRLRAVRPGVEVVNAGVWGYTLYQGRRRFEEMLAFHPDMVIISFGANDAHQVTVPDVAYVRGHDRIARLTRLTEKLRRVMHGAVEVNSGVIASVIITIAAFIPLFTMRGVEGQIFGPMARRQTSIRPMPSMP